MARFHTSQTRLVPSVAVLHWYMESKNYVDSAYAHVVIDSRMLIKFVATVTNTDCSWANEDDRNYLANSTSMDCPWSRYVAQ